MKVLQINATFINGGSTGRIVADLKNIMEQNGIDSYVAYGIKSTNKVADKTFHIQSKKELLMSQLQSRIFASHGFNNVAATKRLVSYMDEVHPDIIHLHNIHGYYVNCKMLFDYIKKVNIPVVWTLHDCWAFTGWCAYFDFSMCDRWKTHCHNCPSKKDYPIAWFSSRASHNFNLKRDTFCGVKNMMLVTPSRWLANLTRESFLDEYPVKVINNGVDTNIFIPKPSSLKKSLRIDGKKMILAVAGGLTKRKGRDYLLNIPSLLGDDEILVILGIKEKQKDLLPKEKCIGIPYTRKVEDLAAIYSSADVFINTTIEDNFPTTNIEAMACGTPVITFDTGGSVEPILDGEDSQCVDDAIITSVGGIVPKGDVNSLLNVARHFMNMNSSDVTNACTAKAVKLYNKQEQYIKYVSLYNEIYLSRK